MSATGKQKKVKDPIEFELLGEVAVDSGMLLICDPCNGSKSERVVLDAVEKREQPSTQVSNEIGVSIGSVAHLGHDGFYEVYLEKTDGEVTGIYIPMNRII